MERTKENFLQIKENVKKQFVGLDVIIDEIFENIEIWYMSPELLERPIIINLWGMTGVGKTDLVRKIVNEFNIFDNYTEVQLINNDGNNGKKLQDVLVNNSISCLEPGILLLDEIQRFRTVNEVGTMIDNVNYSDVWELLSDGKFSDTKDLLRELREFNYNKYWHSVIRYNAKYKEYRNILEEDVSNVENSDYEKKEDNHRSAFKRIFGLKSYRWEAIDVKKRLFAQNYSVEELMKMDNREHEEIISKELELALKLGSDYRKYNQLLIFISGNLDEVYSSAFKVADVNTDADILHLHSKKINLLDIKRVLLQKFKPEQIARMGNIHIIYPSLSKESYRELIQRHLNKIQTKYENFTIEFDKKIIDIIYDNGVIPSQGTRPLFSTLTSIIDNAMVYFIYECKKMTDLTVNNDLYIDVLYADNKIFLTCTIKNMEKTVLNKEIKLKIDELKQEKSIDELSLIAVHECGHALAYSLLYGVVPNQLDINSLSYGEGFIISHRQFSNKDMIMKDIQVGLAGCVAEEIVYGNNYKTVGSESDIASVTHSLMDVIKKYGMDGFIGRQVTNGTNGSDLYEISEDTKICELSEQYLREYKSKTKELLLKNADAFKCLINNSMKQICMDGEDIHKSLSKYIPHLKVLSSDHLLTDNYNSMLNNYLTK